MVAACNRSIAPIGAVMAVVCGNTSARVRWLRARKARSSRPGVMQKLMKSYPAGVQSTPSSPGV